MAQNTLYFGIILVVVVLTGGQLLSSYVSRTNTHQLLNHQQKLQGLLDSQQLHVKQLQESIKNLKEKHKHTQAPPDTREVQRLQDKLQAESDRRKTLEKQLRDAQKAGTVDLAKARRDRVKYKRQKQLLEAGEFFPEMKSMPEPIMNETTKQFFERFQQGKKRMDIELDTCKKQTDPCRARTQWKVDGRPLITPEKQIHHQRKEHFKNLERLFEYLPELRRDAKQLFDKVVRDNAIYVVPINRGYFDFFLNWWASCKLAKIDLSNLIVFAADAGLDKKVRELGLTSFYHDGLGDYPVRSATLFGDSVFTQMMWLKTLSVWLVLDAGYDVLFQDADLVWYDDPLEYIKDPRNWMHEIKEETHKPLEAKNDLVDAFFMDDGSRSNRFEPYYANSGFFFLRSNRRTLKYWDSVMFMNDMTLDWQSQQQLVNHYLLASCQHGMRTVTLCASVFMSGPLSIKLEKGEVQPKDLKPVVWHVNYTPERGTKAKRMLDMGVWYLDPAVWPSAEEAKRDAEKREHQKRLKVEEEKRKHEEALQRKRDRERNRKK